MLPSSHSTSTLPETTSNHGMSDLPDCLRTFHARRKRGIIAASKRGSSSDYALPPAFHSCLNWRTTSNTTSTSDLDHGRTVDPRSRTTAMTKNDDQTTTSVQRMRHNIHRKRGVWQQMALRNRHEANPHHQEMLQSLKDAAQRAKPATGIMDRAVPSDSSEELIPPQVLLKQAQLQNFATQATTSGVSSAYASPDVNTLDTNTAAVRIQANYRGFKTRRTRHGTIVKGKKEPPKDNHTSRICLSFVPHVQQPRFERQVSNITMSDLGDSTHHTFSQDTMSYVNRSRSSIDEGIEEDHDDSNDDLFTADKLVRCNGEFKPRHSPSQLANKDSHCRTTVWHHLQLDAAESTGGFQDRICTPNTSTVNRDHASNMTVCAKKLARTPKHHASRSTIMAAQMDDCTEDIRLMTAMGHASLSSYFGPPMASNFQSDTMKDEFSHIQTENSKRLVQISTSRETPSRSQKFEDFIDSMLEGDNDDDDDDVSLAQSFFEDQSRVDKLSLTTCNTLHRSEGSLDFSSTLERRAAIFRDVFGTVPASCFHLSLNSKSRWDHDGLPDPTSISHLPPKHQMTISKAAVSTFLPVRQPPRKLSPINLVTATAGNMRSGKTNNSPTSTIFSPTESTEPSPTMPLRKASSHGTTHHLTLLQCKDGEKCSYKSLIPAPPLTRQACRRPSRRATPLSELTCPPLPIRKVSCHDDAVHHCSQGDRTLNVEPCISAMAAATILEDGPIRQPQRKVSSFLSPENQLL